MKEIVFASNNQNKLKEIKVLLKYICYLKTLKELGCKEEIPETSATIEGNALQKAKYIYEHYNENCFADDTGLEVEALNGAPGIYSARYAGPEKDAQANMDKLLKELNGVTNRKAHFKTVIALVLNGKEYLFEGKVSGVITEEKRGMDGFGYDPVFLPDGYAQTFGEMKLHQKNQLSHRAIAIKKLANFMKQEVRIL